MFDAAKIIYNPYSCQRIVRKISSQYAVNSFHNLLAVLDDNAFIGSVDLLA